MLDHFGVVLKGSGCNKTLDFAAGGRVQQAGNDGTDVAYFTDLPGSGTAVDCRAALENRHSRSASKPTVG